MVTRNIDYLPFPADILLEIALLFRCLRSLGKELEPASTGNGRFGTTLAPTTHWTPPPEPSEYDRRKHGAAKPPNAASREYDSDHTPTDDHGTKFCLAL